MNAEQIKYNIRYNQIIQGRVQVEKMMRNSQSKNNHSILNQEEMFKRYIDFNLLKLGHNRERQYSIMRHFLQNQIQDKSKQQKCKIKRLNIEVLLPAQHDKIKKHNDCITKIKNSSVMRKRDFQRSNKNYRMLDQYEKNIVGRADSTPILLKRLKKQLESIPFISRIYRTKTQQAHSQSVKTQNDMIKDQHRRVGQQRKKFQEQKHNKGKSFIIRGGVKNTDAVEGKNNKSCVQKLEVKELKVEQHKQRQQNISPWNNLIEYTQYQSFY